MFQLKISTSLPNYNAVIPPKDADGMANSADTEHEHSEYSMNRLIKHISLILTVLMVFGAFLLTVLNTGGVSIGALLSK